MDTADNLSNFGVPCDNYLASGGGRGNGRAVESGGVWCHVAWR